MPCDDPKPQAVAQHGDPQPCLQPGALRLLQTGIHRQRSGFHRQRSLDGERWRHVPRMVEIEVGSVPGEQFRFGQTGGRIGLGMLREVAGRVDGRFDRLNPQIRGAGGALSSTEVDRDAQTPIALMLQRPGIAAAHAHRVPDAQADLRLGGIGAAGAGAGQCLLHGGLQRRQLLSQVGKRSLRGHLSCHTNGPSVTGRTILTAPVFHVPIDEETVRNLCKSAAGRAIVLLRLSSESPSLRR